MDENCKYCGKKNPPGNYFCSPDHQWEWKRCQQAMEQSDAHYVFVLPWWEQLKH